MKSELGQHIGSDLSITRYKVVSRYVKVVHRCCKVVWISNYYDNLSGGRIVLDDPHRVFCFQTFLHFCSLNKLL
jgi:hypothetical protein